MTSQQFNMLDEMEELEAIWYRSKKLAEGEDETFLYMLFQIDTFLSKRK